MSDIKTILLIDDEPDLVEMLKTVLEARGHRVLTASNGLEGLRVLANENPSLIILDMNMPKMGGVAFYNELAGRSEKGRPSSPILVLTARANLEDLFRDLKIDGFMTKPFEIDELVAEAETILRARDGKAGPKSPKRDPKKPVKALVLEDKDAAFLKIEAEFKKKNFSVIRSTSGAAGIERAKAEQPDLVVIKMSLPDLSGDMVAHRLKGMPVTSGLPIVLYAPGFSGTDRTALDRICLEAGVEHAVESDEPAELLFECERILGQEA
jgi:DNA-binding response OmpR family regulator